MTHFFSQFTPDQLRHIYAKNAVGLRRLQAKAEAAGRKVNGGTAEQWRDDAIAYERLSRLSDADLAAHLEESQKAITARLAVLRAS